jgi:hypothetical protein
MEDEPEADHTPNKICDVSFRSDGNDLTGKPQKT